MNLLCRSRISDKLPIPRSQMAIAEPDHTVAVQRAPPNRTVFRPTLWIHEEALYEAFGDPPVVSEQRQVYIDQCVGCRESFPSRWDAPKAINNPLIPHQQIGVCL
jgi:hypothetical protein